jgi:DNA-binding MarR family transcriptional regulator
MGIFDDLFLLRSFVSIVENGSISAAARSLRLPQPTISRHLASLEEKCDVALLRRDTHTMSLTEAGHRLLFRMLKRCCFWQKSPNSACAMSSRPCKGTSASSRQSISGKASSAA